MTTSTFSGPVVSLDGFVGSVRLPVYTTANLPNANSVAIGTVLLVSDNGVGNNEYCIVVNDGTSWKTAVGAALS